MQMSIKTLELQKASLEALRGAAVDAAAGREPNPNPESDAMTIIFYYGSGSPYAWRVHFALEHKALPYERKVLSFSAGDTQQAGVPGAQSAPPRADDRRRRLRALRVERDRRVSGEAYPGTRRAAVSRAMRAQRALGAAPDRGGRQLLSTRRSTRSSTRRYKKPEEHDAAKARGRRTAR